MGGRYRNYNHSYYYGRWNGEAVGEVLSVDSLKGHAFATADKNSWETCSTAGKRKAVYISPDWVKKCGLQKGTIVKYSWEYVDLGIRCRATKVTVLPQADADKAPETETVPPAAEKEEEELKRGRDEGESGVEPDAKVRKVMDIMNVDRQTADNALLRSDGSVDVAVELILKDKESTASTATPNAGKQYVYVVRHGERMDQADATWGESKPNEEKCNPPLSMKGFKQALELGKQFATLPPEQRPTKVISSPFVRCVQTMEKVLEGLALKANTSYVNHAFSEIFNIHIMKVPEPPKKLHKHTFPTTGRLPEFGESHEQAGRRYTTGLIEACKAFPNENLVIITHGDAVGAVARFTKEVEVYQVDVCGYLTLTATHRNSAVDFELVSGTNVAWF